MSFDPANSSLSSLSREINFNLYNNAPVPLIGGLRGYPLWQRDRAINKYNMIAIYWEAGNKVGCCICTVKRWETSLAP